MSWYRLPLRQRRKCRSRRNQAQWKRRDDRRYCGPACPRHGVLLSLGGLPAWVLAGEKDSRRIALLDSRASSMPTRSRHTGVGGRIALANVGAVPRRSRPIKIQHMARSLNRPRIGPRAGGPTIPLDISPTIRQYFRTFTLLLPRQLPCLNTERRLAMLDLSVPQIADASGTLVILFENVCMSAQCGYQTPLFTPSFRSDIVVFELD